MFAKMVDVNTPLDWEKVLSDVQAGTEIILMQGEKPVARIVPVVSIQKPNIPNLSAGAIWMSDDFDAPLPDGFWLGEG